MFEPASSPTAAAPDRAALWEDFIDIFFEPSRVFARRASAGPWLPLIILTAAMAAAVYVSSGLLEPMMSAEFNRSMAVAMRSDPRITPEVVASMKSVTLRIGQFAGILIPFGVLMTGTMAWLVGKLFDATQTYKAAIVVATYAFTPRFLEAVVNELQGLFLDPAQLDGRFRLTLGIGRFLDPDTASSMLLAVVGRIDLFTIWVTVLLAIGLSVTGGITRSRAFMAAPILWLVGAIPLVFQALRG